MTLSLRVEGIDKAIKHLKSYRETLLDKQRRFMERLAELGIAYADFRFAEAQYDGESDVVVQSVPEWLDDNRLAVMASGTKILFIEFGTGVHYSEQHPRAAELGAIRGAYGKGNGKKDTWGYYGDVGENGVGTVIERNGKTLVLTHGNPPARAMYDAGKEMRFSLLEIAREIYG